MLEKKDWYKTAIFYEVYVRAFMDSDGDGHGDLRGLTQKLDYLKELGVDCLWLLPIYPSPLKDDGYDVADYTGIHPDYGDLQDFIDLVGAAHQRDLRVIIDLVLNHTSDQHPWFQSARMSRTSKFRDYYVWSDSNQKYREARIIFLDTEPSNWTWDETAEQYYWHRFYASQPDLNFDNPAVHNEMFKIIKFWLDLGVDGFRVDAVPYLYERDDTNCENLYETHQFLIKMRTFIDAHFPGRILLCEANQLPDDVREYFGDGDEFHLGFHFPLMPRIFKALKQGDKAPIVWSLENTPAIPENCQWCLFLRNHDELTLEMVTEEDRKWMWEEYAPEPRMRLNLGIRRRLAPLLDNDQDKIILAHSLLLTLPGIPFLYYGDEIGMGDNITLSDRNGVRTPMQWGAGQNAGFSLADSRLLYSPVIDDREFGYKRVNVDLQNADPDSIFNRLRSMIQVRKDNSAFALGEIAWVDSPKDFLTYFRTWKDQRILVVNNLIQHPQNVRLNVGLEAGLRLKSLLDEVEILVDSAGECGIKTDRYGIQWFRVEM